MEDEVIDDITVIIAFLKWFDLNIYMYLVIYFVLW